MKKLLVSVLSVLTLALFTGLVVAAGTAGGDRPGVFSSDKKVCNSKATCQIEGGRCIVCGSEEGGCKCVGECVCGKAVAEKHDCTTKCGAACKQMCKCGAECRCATDSSACKCGEKCCCVTKSPAANMDPTAQDVVTDPVCGMDVKAEGSKYSYEYKGKTYHFCCESCRDRFKSDPSKFLGE